MPCEIICSEADSPQRIRPFVSMPMIRLPTKAPMTLPYPDLGNPYTLWLAAYTQSYGD
jgi:hypothetical protein